MEEITVESSNVSTIAYDAGNLLVRFKSGIQYKYLNVPPEKFEALKAAESKGKFLNAEIKPAFDFERVS